VKRCARAVGVAIEGCCPTMRKLMRAKRIAYCSRRSTRITPNVCIAIGPDT
jgi:hypothetical protein